MPSSPKENSPESSQTKYGRIISSLRERILRGEFRVGDRLPSEFALMKKFGVSRPTAARALKELSAEGIITRRAGAGSFVSGAKEIAGRRQLGLLIPQWETTEIFEMICGQLASLARTQDFAVQWSSSRGRIDAGASSGIIEKIEREQVEALCGEFIERKVDGVFFAPLELSPDQHEWNHRIGERFRQAGIPVILIDRDIEPFPNRSHFDIVGLDNLAAGHLLASHLLKLGCTRIAFFTRPLSASSVAARIAGVREAMLNAGLEWDDSFVIEGDPANQTFVKKSLLSKKWDACICANDRTAAQILQTVLKLGARVPHDLRIVGFDDVKYATLMAVPLTTVHQPCDEIASIAFDAMLRRLATPLAPSCNFRATPRLVVRESCGTYLPR